MSYKIWIKIINELSELQYKGRISPHFYGEPLLDKRLADMIAYARKKCPDAYILIDSNGDFLDEAVIKQLYSSGVNKLFVTSYDNLIPDRLNSLKDKYPAIVFLRTVLDFNKVNRSGKIFDTKTKLNRICYNPSFQLVVNWQGDVLLCCMDYYKEVVFGNVKNKCITDIWFDKRLVHVRKYLREAKREKIAICKYCDHEGNIPW